MRNIGDGMSTINGDKEGSSPIKIGNFNEYQHVYNDHKSNEANVNWITRLRESESASTNGGNLISISRMKGDDKSSVTHTE